VLRSPGEPLDPEVRREHETRIGHDLSEVRVHAAPTNPVAGIASSEMNAHAFTVGQHVVMADDAPHAGTPEGRELLAHELRHVVDHQHPRDPKSDSVGMLSIQPTDSADERDAARSGSLSSDEADAEQQSVSDVDELSEIDGGAAVDSEGAATDELQANELEPEPVEETPLAEPDVEVAP